MYGQEYELSETESEDFVVPALLLRKVHEALQFQIEFPTEAKVVLPLIKEYK